MNKLKLIISALIAVLILIVTPMAALAANEGESASENSTSENSVSGNDFDRLGPDVDGAVTNGVLKIRALDRSGIKVIYVNGYEYMDVENGKLIIRLQQFDANYENFVVSAMDKYGNKSSEYVIPNPYYLNPEFIDSQSVNAADTLPSDATASDPGKAEAAVIEHMTVDAGGNAVYENLQTGKEFYTIQTESGKTFYLIIDRTVKDSGSYAPYYTNANPEDILNEDPSSSEKEVTEKVYFLTPVDENDLLNTTSNNSQTIPMNSAAMVSGIPVTEPEELDLPLQPGETQEIHDEYFNPSVSDNQVEPPKKKKIPEWLIYAVIGAAVFGVAFYVKIIKPKHELKYAEDEDAAEQEEEYRQSEAIEYDNQDITGESGNVNPFGSQNSDESFFADEPVTEEDDDDDDTDGAS